MNISRTVRAAGVLAILAASLSAQNRPVFEENFESGKLDPAVWDQRVTGMAARSYAFIVATHLPESVRTHFFGRAYMNITPGLGTTHNPRVFAGEAGWPISKFDEIGTSRGNWMPSYRENKSAAGQGRGEVTYRSDTPPPLDKWFLLEWEFNDDPSTIAIRLTTRT